MACVTDGRQLNMDILISLVQVKHACGIVDPPT